MKSSFWTCVFLAAWSTGFGQEPGKGLLKIQDGKLLAEIECQEALSFSGDAKMTSQFNKVSIMLFRHNEKGEKVRGMTIKADQGSAESPSDGRVRMITLNGNVRAEQRDGTVINAKEAVIDMVEETVAFKMDIGVDIPKK